ncbi:MAG TPA: DUF3099 domain-containing protein [Microbacteriaceae bacterium]|nr:DUF3099 domain-containing protein [Microbacteriaceae bacterium]HQX35677.1 DUF3099 domain-containing protein [Microbacteriaceae bacterium]HQZ47059.1 DUF3099 domain-containing protein [Microbacteriaceae bacterium]HRA09247.1 DUF3099 domain-containing protein [Microbacteriaceae bacterium]
MKTPSATSLPRAPRDESSARFRNYVILMVIRVTCFALMVLITPYGWYTWVLAVGAVFLPYIAVMIANVGSGPPVNAAETAKLSLSSTPDPVAAPESAPQVIQISEATPPQPAPRREPASPAPPSSGSGRVFEAGPAESHTPEPGQQPQEGEQS